MQDKLKEMQKKVDELYKETGLTDEVLNLQVEINKLRNKHNLPDETETIHEEWVQ